MNKIKFIRTGRNFADLTKFDGIRSTISHEETFSFKMEKNNLVDISIETEGF